jgi:hypothetical protein
MSYVKLHELWAHENLGEDTSICPARASSDFFAFYSSVPFFMSGLSRLEILRFLSAILFCGTSFAKSVTPEVDNGHSDIYRAIKGTVATQPPIVQIGQFGDTATNNWKLPNLSLDWSICCLFANQA